MRCILYVRVISKRREIESALDECPKALEITSIPTPWPYINVAAACRASCNLLAPISGKSEASKNRGVANPIKKTILLTLC